MTDERPARIGVLWRGDRQAAGAMPASDRGLQPLFDALAQLPVELEMVPFDEGALDQVRSHLLRLDGVLVWVNPIQDGQNRGEVDRLLREVSARGVWVSAHPDVAMMMGTKEVLFRTRHLSWGGDTYLYRSVGDLTAEFPRRLGRMGRLVLKQARGNGGNGVWRVDLPSESPRWVDMKSVVRVQDAKAKDANAEMVSLGSFLERCDQYFNWSGSMVDQPFVDRLPEGMLRCYLSRDQVVGFCHQWPTALLGQEVRQGATRPRIWEGPDAPAYQHARAALAAWVPQMCATLGLAAKDLPVIWDADLLYGPKDVTGADTYVLCEINVSAVWPFPPVAAPTVAEAALDGVRASRPGRREGRSSDR